MTEDIELFFLSFFQNKHSCFPLQTHNVIFFKGIKHEKKQKGGWVSLEKNNTWLPQVFWQNTSCYNLKATLDNSTLNINSHC